VKQSAFFDSYRKKKFKAVSSESLAPGRAFTQEVWEKRDLQMAFRRDKGDEQV
jgi:hypothetical protein